MLSLLKHSKDLHLGVPMVPTTDYINTIAPENEPAFPGNEELERRYRAWIRWNAAITVHRAQRPGIGVGGHISTYASSAALYEVGHNWFFRGADHAGGGDLQAEALAFQQTFWLVAGLFLLAVWPAWGDFTCLMAQGLYAGQSGK
eukprot:gene20458-25078_t